MGLVDFGKCNVNVTKNTKPNMKNLPILLSVIYANMLIYTAKLKLSRRYIEQVCILIINVLMYSALKAGNPK